MTILVAILLFGIIVFIHELGHFLLAKKAGIRVHEFAVGMGPKLFGFKKGETLYSIRLLPLGGYCSMEGEDADSKDPKAFGQKTILQRASVLFAGPFFNIIFAVILLIPVFLYTGTPSDSNVLGRVLDKSPAMEIGLKENDKIIEVNGNKVDKWDDIVTNLHTSEGKEINIKIERNNDVKDFKIQPQKNEQGRYVIGIVPVYEKNVLVAIKTAFTTTIEMMKQMLIFLGQLITGTIPGGFDNAVAGPVGVIGIVSDAARTGIINLIYIGSMISLNLGIFNLLPVPALDGGRLLFLAVEAIRGGKKIDPNKEGMINTVGFMLLIGFMLFVTYKDVLKLF